MDLVDGLVDGLVRLDKSDFQDVSQLDKLAATVAMTPDEFRARFGYLVGFMAVMAAIGLIPTVALFVVFFMRYEARERWSLVIPYASALVLFIWFAFDYFMAVPWPPTLIV